MFKAVLDTNVLVSALWTPLGKSAYIVKQVADEFLQVFYDDRIISEYKDVLSRPKFKFSSLQVNFLFETIENNGICLEPARLPEIDFIDESDRKFFELAKYCNVPLVTGNLKYYPRDNLIITVAEFYEKIYKAYGEF